MEYLKRKTFWFAAIALLVFCTDIWVYFYLKDASRLSVQPPTVASAFSKTSDKDILEIKTRATKLTSDDIQILVQDAVNPQAHQDLRFKSVYLPVRTGHIPEILKQIVITPMPENLNERERDFEHIVRAQAIDGSAEVQDNKEPEKIIEN